MVRCMVDLPLGAEVPIALKTDPSAPSLTLSTLHSGCSINGGFTRERMRTLHTLHTLERAAWILFQENYSNRNQENIIPEMYLS